MNIELQVIGAALRSIADEMGAALVRSAFSANIKERRDCSTALFDARGRMVAQAEHIPVHLGAMPDAVAAVRAHDPGPDDVWILNDPFAGGTHLPDITLVTRTRVGYAVTRAPHADVGAAEPGSLPAESRRLDEEGVVIPPTRLDDKVLDQLVSRMRNPDERRGDLRAQLAAHRLASRRLDELCARRGQARVEEAMDELHAYSERLVRSVIARLPDGRFEAADVLEPAGGGELEIRAAVTVAGNELEIDFTGTAPQHDGNLNCPISVTRSACYFVVRCLTDPDVPASGGAFVPVSVGAPEGSLVNARPPAAVAAGNVETSSRIVDVVFAAFGQALPVPAQGQGTMNNLTLGATASPTTRRSAAVRERAPARTGRRACTSRCRTRSRPRRRRSSLPIRCGSSGTGCGSARAGLASTGAATASSGSCGRSRTAGSRSSASAARGRHRARAEERRAGRAATC